MFLFRFFELTEWSLVNKNCEFQMEIVCKIVNFMIVNFMFDVQWKKWVLLVETPKFFGQNPVPTFYLWLHVLSHDWIRLRNERDSVKSQLMRQSSPLCVDLKLDLLMGRFLRIILSLYTLTVLMNDWHLKLEAQDLNFLKLEPAYTSTWG
jgi:hypothetical protein